MGLLLFVSLMYEVNGQPFPDFVCCYQHVASVYERNNRAAKLNAILTHSALYHRCTPHLA